MATKKVWIPVSENSLPVMTKHAQHGHLLKESEPVIVKIADGKGFKAVIGTARQYLVDANAPHINAKKGDWFFMGTDGIKIDEPVSYFPVGDLVKLLEPEKEAPAKQEPKI